MVNRADLRRQLARVKQKLITKDTPLCLAPTRQGDARNKGGGATGNFAATA
jgi:hypothetical protein